MVSLFGSKFPGGKAKLRPFILETINRFPKCQYREPFFGGGAIGISILRQNDGRSLWLNDFDMGIQCLWETVKRFPEVLKELLGYVKPSKEYYALVRKYLLSKSSYPETDDDIIELGFAKLACHRLSYCGHAGTLTYCADRLTRNIVC